MGEWRTVPAFTDQQVVRAESLQDMWTNLYNLKNREQSETLNPGGPSNAWLYDVTVFADIDSSAYQIPLKTYGGDLLVLAEIRYSHEAASGFGVFAFALDGVRAGNSLGLAIGRDIENLQETRQMIYFWRNVVEGNHTLTVQWSDQAGASLSLEVWKNACLGMTVVEL